jgi:CRISPR-associated protein Csd1
MILESLVALAHREQLVEEPAFQSVPVRFIVSLNARGEFVALDKTDYLPQTEGKRKPKTQYKLRQIPRRSGRTSGDKAEFLVDKSDYVLGVLPESVASERSAPRLDLFAKELQEAASAIEDAELESVLAFLRSEEQRKRCVEKLIEEPFASNDLFTFRVEGKMLDEDPTIRAWWAARMVESSSAGASAQCLLCGERKPAIEKHDSVKLPGAVTSGVALVSFNADAFEKHGLSRNENAPVCRECMVAYVNALRRCLDARYPDSDGGFFPPQNMRLSDNTIAVYWDDASTEVTANLWSLNYEDPSAVKALLESVWKGMRPAVPTARFFCLLLTGSQGRASVRGMHTGTVEEVVKNLCGDRKGECGYFVCLEAAGYTERPAPLSVLLRSLAVQGKLDGLPPGIAGELFLSAVLGKPLSRWFLTTTLARIRAERTVPRPRAALLHLYFQRSIDPELRMTPMSLDVDSLNPAYRYGRLLAVLERLQIRALGRTPNSTIVDRFYAAASTRPATAFPPLLALAQNHLRATEYSSSFSKEIGEILAGLEGADGFKRTLSIEEQGRFALGYFHQRSAGYAKKITASSDESEPAISHEENEK